jgi:hypothetical protein
MLIPDFGKLIDDTVNIVISTELNELEDGALLNRIVFVVGFTISSIQRDLTDLHRDYDRLRCCLGLQMRRVAVADTAQAPKKDHDSGA